MHINYLSQIKKNIYYYYYFGNINCLSKIFSKIDFKFYSNITTHNKTYRYI